MHDSHDVPEQLVLREVEGEWAGELCRYSSRAEVDKTSRRKDYKVTQSSEISLPLRIISPFGICSLLPNEDSQIHDFVKLIGFCPGVTDETFLV